MSVSQKNWQMWLAGALALLTTVVHIFAGGGEIAAPILQSTLPDVVRFTFLACWHFVSVFLAGSALFFLWPSKQSFAQVEYCLALIYLAFAAVFLAIVILNDWPSLLYLLPQWLILLPIGLLVLWHLRRQKLRCKKALS